MSMRSATAFENPLYRFIELHFGAYVLLHILLALVIQGSASLATLYFLLFFGAAVGLAAMGRVEVAAFAACYAAGAEVLGG